MNRSIILDEAEPGHGQEAVGLAHAGRQQKVPAGSQASLTTQVLYSFHQIFVEFTNYRK
jgi:hypothetical protein